MEEWITRMRCLVMCCEGSWEEKIYVAVWCWNIPCNDSYDYMELLQGDMVVRKGSEGRETHFSKEENEMTREKRGTYLPWGDLFVCLLCSRSCFTELSHFLCSFCVFSVFAFRNLWIFCTSYNFCLINMGLIFFPFELLLIFAHVSSFWMGEMFEKFEKRFSEMAFSAFRILSFSNFEFFVLPIFTL